MEKQMENEMEARSLQVDGFDLIFMIRSCCRKERTRISPIIEPDQHEIELFKQYPYEDPVEVPTGVLGSRLPKPSHVTRVFKNYGGPV